MHVFYLNTSIVPVQGSLPVHSGSLSQTMQMTVNDLDLSVMLETVHSYFCFGIFSFHFWIVDGLFSIVDKNFIN